ncbi:hypothetical protein [Thiothrix subterranea]|uniref:hypothetical protein n=1 Tax=Thiothrix subterranea TaxID=2735563 RepID=UPI00280B8268|nr:hypothetical protein [Thiothrix subterranea]
MIPQKFLNYISDMNVWYADGRREPHKPLMLLLALARIQAGKPRLMPFDEIEEKLQQIIEDFGPIAHLILNTLSGVYAQRKSGKFHKAIPYPPQNPVVSAGNASVTIKSKAALARKHLPYSPLILNCWNRQQ